MKHFTFKLSLAFIILTFTAFVSKSQISGTNTVLNIPGNTPTVVDAGIKLNGIEDINTITIQITGGYVSGGSGDILSYNGTLPSGTSASYDNTYGILRIVGTASPADWQAFLRTVTLQTTSAGCYAQKRSVTFVLGNKLYNPSNGHFYADRDVWDSWAASKLAAESTSYYGRKGYLATITSQDENDFLFNTTSYLSTYNPWIGASDNFSSINAAIGVTTYANQAASDGKFYWVTGPEAGNQFSNKNTWESGGTSSVAGRFMTWNSGEPNDYPDFSTGTPGEEDYVQFLAGSATWNDADGSSSKSIIEYGDMPYDAATNNIAHSTRNIIITGASSGTVTSNNNNVCPGSNNTTLTLSGLTGTVVKWQSSISQYFTNPSDIANTTTSLNITNITQTTFYRAIVNSTSPQTCSNLPTSITELTVTPTIVGNITAATNSICDGGKVILALAGNEGDVLNWQRSTSPTFSSGNTTINNQTNLLTETLGSSGTYYYRAQINNNSCGAAYTAGKTITVVSGTQNVGGSLISIALCGGATSGTLTLSGQTGSINKWQQSTDNGIVWSDIASTSNPLNFSGLTSNTTTFRAVVGTNACPTDNSLPANVYINNVNGTWTGNSSNNWTSSSNWCGGVPTLTTDVIIPAGRRFDPSIDNTARCRNLTVQYGGFVDNDGNEDFEIAGVINSDHAIEGRNANIFMMGSSAQVLPADAFFDNEIEFLSIDNANGITLSGNLLITDELDLNVNNGLITTTSADLLSIDDGASISGFTGSAANTRYINGPLRKYGNDDFTFPIGNKGKYAPCRLEAYSSNSSSQHYTAEYFKKPLTVLAMTSGFQSVSGKEHWNIDKSVGASNDVDVTLYYFDKTFSGIVNSTGETSARLRIAHFNISTQLWEDNTGTGSPASASTVAGGNSVKMTDVSNFSPFTFGSPSGFNPLPVTLLDFVAIPDNASKTVELKWETTNEENSKHFEVMHSTDFINWTVIGTVNSLGSKNLNSYSFNHMNPSSVNHYKLREVANNGDYSYSDIKLARFSAVATDKVVIYPNPSSGAVVLTNAGEESSFEITDLTGRIIQKGNFNNTITVQNLPQGVYIVKIVSDGTLQNEKIIVQ